MRLSGLRVAELREPLRRLRSAAASVNNEVGMHLVLQRIGVTAADANSGESGALPVREVARNDGAFDDPHVRQLAHAAANVLLEERAACENAFQRALVVPLPDAEVVPAQVAAQL